MKILFINSNRVGDAVLSTGLLAWLERQYPAARFTVACGPYAAGLFRAVPRLERLIVLEKRSWNRHWLELWRVCASTRWDLIVDLRNSIVSRLLRAQSRAIRVALDGQHKVIENAAALALDPPPAPHIWIDAAAKKQAAEIFGLFTRGKSGPDSPPPVGRVRMGGAQPHANVEVSQTGDGNSNFTPPPLTPPARGGESFLALAPAANWPVKQWPIERFAALAQKLTATDGPLAGACVVVIAGANEREQIEMLLQSIAPEKRVEVIGQHLLVAAACIERCRLFVGNDSGLMHVAAAVGTPTLGLFGPGHEHIYGPWGDHCAVVRTDENREELLSLLPDLSARSPNLMRGLSVEKVYEAAVRLLRTTRAERTLESPSPLVGRVRVGE